MSELQLNRFGGPIPGMGLTTPPGAMPCQKPPMFVHLDEALEFVWERLTLPQNVGQVLALLSHGELSAQDLADVILMQGFVGGLWTVTLGLLMVKPVWQMVASIGHKAGIKFQSATKKPDPLVKMMTELQLANKSGMSSMLQPDQSQSAGQDQTQQQPGMDQSQGQDQAPPTPHGGFGGMASSSGQPNASTP